MSQNETEPMQDNSDISVQIDWEPKQSKWPMIIALLAVIGLGFGIWKLVFDVKLEPTKILIVVETETLDGARGAWWGSKGKVSARYADAMAAKLEELGFEPIFGADPEFLKEMEDTDSLDDIMVLAKSKGIQWVLAGTIKPTKEMPIKGSDEKRIDTIIETHLELYDMAREPSSEPLLGVHLSAPTFFLTWQSDFESALEKHNVELLVDRHIADVAKSLADTDTLSPYSTTDQETSEATILASKLEPLFALSRRYDLALDARKKAIEEGEEETTKNKPTPTTRLLTSYETSELYVGETPDGIISLREAR